MNKTMKAAVARAFGKPLVIEEVEVPRPGPGYLDFFCLLYTSPSPRD